ncbi:MAG TPA: Flp family type IVb pilin [bacterium]|nr:Flp family type IVb pilin [bacterium]
MRKRLDQKGQGMTEYILIVALIAVVAIAAVKMFGKNVKSGFENASQQVGGAVANPNGNSGAVGNAANAVNNAAGVVGGH